MFNTAPDLIEKCCHLLFNAWLKASFYQESVATLLIEAWSVLTADLLQAFESSRVH